MNDLIPELGSAVTLINRLDVEHVPYRISWSAVDRITFFVGDLELRPMWNSVKVWLNGTGIGCFPMDCHEIGLQLMVLLCRAESAAARSLLTRAD